MSIRTEQLPALFYSKNWMWKRLSLHSEFWVGEDEVGNRWLLKGRGGFYALREKSFSYLSQQLGINTQSSTYLILSDEHRNIFSGRQISKYQLAIEYLDEHNPDNKECIDCPIGSYVTQFESSDNKLSTLYHSIFPDALDWVKADMLAYICGANEPSDRLFTKDHRSYTIDNEQMFSTEPVDLMACDWFYQDREKAIKVAIDLCERIAEITNDDIHEFTSIPEQYYVNELWSIEDRMIRSRDYAIQFIHEHTYKRKDFS